ncbi:nicotinate-nucleotide--dimethylbenzimidazole phosphoribosyltransferase [Clostridium fallax]|uniref:Nicotinate-nucleotide--dimethylbenzimidazole phosphoribosyltransferase n=1 Tax=Clostridium fallax TaxID=1533 RepID=A0A1M4Y398_9CLOT|nr:nicotinate-nucleotide--dimethylbenzimidazole phosphoribosyltransferase [Clostridium fallax]SHF00159.1 nicotinate-nucleotide-dimethylbenzimidazole phosphoribosyltransferase [Clostridium fallax]SQB07797.1 nicotinate-nucleotide--dimethylbenzimidazole phosphoribosyltransferase CobT [Clostridium fallax]
MSYKKLQQIIRGIEDIDKSAMSLAKKRLDSLAKPLGSLGKLEDLAAQLSGITGKVKNNINKKRIIIMSSDNGVICEGVASGPQYITLAQTINFTKGVTGVGVLAKHYGVDLMVVDVGINGDVNEPKVIDRKIRKGTNNINKEPAMTYDEAVKAILIGVEMAERSKKEGYDILGVGEMGIGNTTTSSAVMMALTGCKVEKAVGKGAGLTDEGFERKKYVVENSIKVNNPNIKDSIDVVSKVGGFDIAAMAGVFLGAAYFKIPIVIDGFISAVAALVAVRLNPLVKKYLITSHCSQEVGYNLIMNEIDIEPMLNLKMRLGEGSGCPIAFSIVEAACAIMSNMITFEEGNMTSSHLDPVREKRNYIVDDIV